MSSRTAKSFKIKSKLSVRYILRFTDEGYEAECIDAGAVGIGESQLESLQDLVTNLQALYEFAVQEDLTMIVPAHQEDERQYARLAARQPVEPSVVGYGVIQRVEVVPTASGRRQNLPTPAGFEVSQHVSLAA